MTPPQHLAHAARLLSLLGHPGRLHALWVLDQEGACSAGELAERVGLEQSAMSHQLKILREFDLVRSVRDGRRRVYRIADEHVACIIRDALGHAAEGEAAGRAEPAR